MWRTNAAELEATKEKVAQINRRANKRGFTGRISLEVRRVEIPSRDDFGFERVDVVFDVTLTGEPPCYDGWQFLATLDWDQHAGLIVRAAPGADEVNRDELKPNHCDHCKTVRTRIKTYLVQNKQTKQQLQVGSTCLKDFLGWAANVVFISEDDVTGLLGGGYGGGAPDSVSTTYAMAVAWALIKLDGYRPASNWGRTTKGDVLDVLWPPRRLEPERRQELERIRELAAEATERAQECIAWVLSEDFKGSGDYAKNLKAVASAEYVSASNIGLLASAPQTWAKWQSRTLIRETPNSEWLGKERERITFTGVLSAITYVEGDWGSTALYTLQTPEGNIVKWFSSNHALGDKTGETFTLTATIKKLDEYRGVKQTVVTRAKVIE